MSLNFTRMKQIDPKQLLLVSGYIAQSTKSMLFPKEIVTIIILFTQGIEKFIKGPNSNKFSSKDCIFSADTVATILGEDHNSFVWGSLYGKLSINCMDKNENENIYEWMFNIQANKVSIGIHSSDVNEIKSSIYCFGLGIDGAFYAVGDTGSLEWQDRNSSWEIWNQQKFCGHTKKGDQIKMIFNVKNGTLSYCKNGKDLGVAYSNIDKAQIYHLAMAIKAEPGDFVEIVGCSVQR